MINAAHAGIHGNLTKAQDVYARKGVKPEVILREYLNGVPDTYTRVNDSFYTTERDGAVWWIIINGKDIRVCRDISVAFEG